MKFLFTALAVVVVISGCGVNNMDDENVPANQADPTSSDVSEITTLPLDEYLNLVTGTNLDSEVQVQRARELHQRTEELTAQCMNAAGFEYIPDNAAEFRFVEGAEWRAMDRDWVQEFGFGAVNIPPDSPTGAVGIEWEPNSNPNWEIQSQLSEAERAAYDVAFSGPPNPYAPPEGISAPSQITPEMLEWASNPENWGCWQTARAQAESESPAGLPFTDEFRPLFDAITEFRSNLAQLPTQANQDWASCMAENGYNEFTYRPDFNSYFFTLNQELTAELISQGVEGQSGHHPFLPEDAPETQALYEREVATALADLDCRIQTGFETRQNADLVKAELQFIEDHQLEFAALRDAVAQQ